MRSHILGLVGFAALSSCVAVVPVVPGVSTLSSAPTAAQVSSQATGYALSVLTAVNAERAKRGLPALSYNVSLQTAAERHAVDMQANGFFSHKGSNGSTVTQRVKATGYKTCLTAENISGGYPNAQAVVAGWMSSDGHRRNILHRSVAQIGVGTSADNKVVAVFAAPC